MVESRPYSDDQYPDALLKGDVLSQAFLGIEQQLKFAFPEKAFKHFLMPPSSNKLTWQKVQAGKLSVALSAGAWIPESKSANTYRGTLVFSVFLLVAHSRPRDLYLGTSEKWGVGILGMTAMAIGMLHGQAVPGFTEATMQVVRTLYPAGIEWLDECTAVAELEVHVSGVGLSEKLLCDQLPDFLRLAQKWTADGVAQQAVTLNVREDA